MSPFLCQKDVKPYTTIPAGTFGHAHSAITQKVIVQSYYLFSRDYIC